MPAQISGTSTASLTETDSAALLSTSGSLSATDIDSSALFVAQTAVAGSNGYGQFSIGTDGVWTYTANSAHNEFVGGQTYTDSFTVATADGTSQVITVSMTGSNDAAVITGTSTASLTETNSPSSLSTTGSLSATDVDSSAAFVAQTGVAGSNGYGQFSIGTNGAWTYTANSAHNEFVGGQTYTDSFTVATADGTTQVITVSMTGSNDAAVITGTSTASLTETNAAASLSTTGTLSATDVDSSAAFVAQTGVAGSNGYGQFSIGTDGAWTYTANSAHNEFVGGQTYTDSFTVATADGTTQVITVSMTGSNDAAVITGTSTASLTETNAAASLSTTGTLSATDVDSSAAFVAQSNVAGSNGHGQFSIGTDGQWTYTANSAHNEFVGGQTYTDSFTVATADGTTQVITVSMTGSNDAAVITGTSTASLTETNAAASLSTTGTLSATDVDSSALFVAQTGVAGNNSYGQFSIGTDGQWTYTANSAHNEFVGGQTYTDSFTVTTADGTTQVVTVSMTGSNDAAVITGTSTASLTETNAAASLSTTSTLSATDVDSSAAFVAQTGVAGNNGYGQFSIGTNGAWTYTANSAHNEFVGGQTYTDSFTVATADGTSQVITVSMTGSNDAAVITGTSTASLTETNAAASLSTTGTLSATDVDSSAAFVAQSNVSGNNGYGQFSIGADGAWTYTANSAHNEFVGGQTYTDSLTVATADGTTQVITVSMTGSNETVVFSGTSNASLTESNNAASLSTSGAVTASDLNGNVLIVAQSNVAGNNGYGQFSIGTDGAWTYTANSAHNEFVGGQTYTDSFTVATADGTSQVITVSMTGSNDAAVITGTSTASLTETNAAASLSTTGTLSATDVDSSAAFVAQTGVAGNNGYGQFSIGTDGQWTYTANSAHNEFVGGQTYTDSFTVATVDGTSQVITVTMTGTNDTAVVSGTSAGTVTKDSLMSTATGTLTDTDADNTPNTFQTVGTATISTAGYGTYTMTSGGVWTYTLDNTNVTVNALSDGQTLSDSFTVMTLDGTRQVITVTINGVDEVKVTALSTLSEAATSNSASDSSPGVEVYGAAGVSGVTADNLKAINSVLNTTGVSATSVDTTAEVQALVDAYKLVLAGADADASDDNVSVTTAQYGLLGVEGLGAKSTSLLNDVVDAKAQTEVDTAAELQVLASAAEAVIAAAGGTSGPSLAQLQALGVSGVTADNLAAVQAAIANTADDGSGVSSLSALQSVVSAAASAAASALSTLSEAATSNSASDSSPGVEVYGAAGVSGVTADNLKAINSVLNTTGVSATSVDTTAEVQALVDAYKLVLAGADADASDDNVSVTTAQYGLLGVEGLGAKSTSLLNDVVDAKAQTEVDTAAELQVLASAAEAIFDGQPSVDQLKLLGLSGVTDAKLAAIQSAISSALSNGEDLSSLANLQTLVSSINNPPVLNSNLEVALPTILEDDPSPIDGTTGTSSLVSDLVSLAGNVQDADADALTGIAITGISSHGTLQYTLDGGTTWHVAQSVSSTHALLLKADTNTRIHFTPEENFNGALTDALTFKAWDQTSGDAGSYVDTSNGLSFSIASDSVSIDITPVNDTPVVVGPSAISLVDTAAADTFANVTGTLSASDAESATLSYGVTGSTSGSYTVNSVNYDLQKVGTY
ncbi:VCBS domain-containing protein, partial [Limnohabitans sp. JirII-29]|uniref:beta strand repeat-containing protein n=2 Tax=unclassified Limnohabitans TaxID=2626134 RepID=UPI001304EB8F